MTKDKWVWMPHAGHFIMGNECRFHLNTYVGGYIVSTVGELVMPKEVRDILEPGRKARGREMPEFEELGLGRKYETMVFKAMEAPDGCCPYRQVSGSSVDMNGYNDPAEAFKGHLKLCKKWSTK